MKLSGDASGSYEHSEDSVQGSSSDLENPLDDYLLVRDGTRREIREYVRMTYYLSFAILSYKDLASKEPKSYEEPVSCQLSKEW